MTAPDASPSTEARIAAIRRFSRFYTSVIGALREGLLDSRFSLTEARVLFELANRNEVTASMLGRDLNLDAGYLSRILQRFAQERLVERAVSRPSPATWCCSTPLCCTAARRPIPAVAAAR